MKLFAITWIACVMMLALPIVAQDDVSVEEGEDFQPISPLQGLQLIAPPLQPAPLVAADTAVDPQALLPDGASQSTSDFIAELLREHIPVEYVDDKEWNRTKEVYAGVKLSRDGWNLKTKRRWKEVNHGRWRLIHLRMINPDQRMKILLSDVYWQEDGRLHGKLQITTDISVMARQQLWNLGVRIYSAHVESRATLTLNVEATIGFGFDTTEVPPAVVVDPQVIAASLQMDAFEVDRIGHLGGDFAEELGDAAESLIRREIVKPQSRKLASKMNRQIDKRRDRLRLSMGDWLTRLMN